jgi:hypothetical protein
MEFPADSPLLHIGELELERAVATAQIATAAGARLMAGDPVTGAERTGWPR